MKRLILGISIGILAGFIFLTIAFADEKIVPVGENNMEFTESYTVTDVNGVDFEVWDKTVTYGQKRIDRELSKAQQDLIDANAFDCVKHQQELKDIPQKKIGQLQRIQVEIDKL